MRRLKCWIDGHDYVIGIGWRLSTRPTLDMTLSECLSVTVCMRCGARSVAPYPLRERVLAQPSIPTDGSE